MPHAFLKFYYWSALALCVVIFVEMAIVAYRGLVLPSAVLCLVVAALAGVLLGDWLLQIGGDRLS